VFERPRTGERAVLVRLGVGSPLDPEDLEEFAQLALSAGAAPVARVTGRRNRPDPRYFVGSGKAAEIRDVAAAQQADVVLIDHPLSPGQERNLEKLIGRRVLDRSALILDIFAQRARSFEGKLEVELAQLQHLSTRLVRGWTHLERQKGGIGLRGPGETQLETDRRLIARRMRGLSKRLERIRQQRDTGRQARAEIPVPSIALVGYTNAGKSTLFRALTGADAYVANLLFATLDPLVRRIRLPGGVEVVLADTVGFIRELPHELVAAFQSTLTEAREATLLLHVVDASDPRRAEHMEQVVAVLREIGAGEIPSIVVYNKIDRLQAEPALERDVDGRAVAVRISAQSGAGLDLLANAIVERIARVARRVRVRLPVTAGALRSRLYRSGTVLEERTATDGSHELTVKLPERELLELAATAGVEILEARPAGAGEPAAEPCAPRQPYLQSDIPASASKLRQA
jgi:GTP-binding protein HflX